MVDTWLSTDWQQVGLVLISALAIFAAVIAIGRIVGLRAFSKMSSFDFSVTIATGSIIASVAASSTSLANGVIALGALYALQWAVAQFRRRTSIGSRIVDNKPLLLMADGRILDDNLTHARVTREDVVAKLREANVLRLDQVRAVVLETTGDVSVLHGEGPIDEALLADVRGVDVQQEIDTARADESVAGTEALGH